MTQVSSEQRAIVRGMLWVGLFVFAAKLVVAVKELLVAWRYGTAEVLEGYLLLFNLLSWPLSVVSAVMIYVLVPWLARQPQGAALQRAQQQITAWMWGLALLLSAAVAVGLPPLLQKGALGLSPAGRAAVQAFLPAMAAVVGLGVVAAWHACQLMSAQKHANSFLEAMPALTLAIAVWLIDAAGVEALLWGTLTGFVLQLALTAGMAHAAGMPVTPAWGGSWQGLAGSEIRAVGWLIGAQLIMSSVTMLDQVLLAHLPAGQLAAFGYANRIIALAIGPAALVVGRAMLPVFARVALKPSHDLAQTWAWRILLLGSMAALGLMFCADPIVTLLYQRGAFDAAATEAVAVLLRWLAPQIPFYLLVVLWMHWATAQAIAKQALWWAALVAVVVKYFCVGLGMMVFDLGGRAVALSITVWLSSHVLALGWVARRAVARAVSGGQHD